MKARWLVPLVLVAVVAALAGPVAPAPGATTLAAAAVARVPAARPVLTFGSRGAVVRRAQVLLNRHGYRVPGTGFYGLLTVRQVRRFQVAHGIRNTGQVGPLTWPRLLGRPTGRRPAPAARPAVVTRPARARAAGSAGVVYLTFDDGPTPAHTPPVLDLLARYRARATFFVVGRSAATWPDLVRREFAAGHGVGNHTWSHRRLTGLSGGRWQAEVGATSATIRRATGSAVRCLRPPYGTVDAASTYRARAQGLRVVLWDLDTNDWRRPGAAVIAGRVLARVHDGAVVLLHDGGGDRSQTVAALQTVLASLSARGFRFSSLCRG
jgi:peptidoglycan-N-acetylglucosamine deacetylase